MMIDMTTLSQHAKRRRKQMHVTEDQIRAAVADPETVYPGNAPGHPTGRTCYQRGPIVVVVNDATDEVVTVLWHGAEGR